MRKAVSKEEDICSARVNDAMLPVDDSKALRQLASTWIFFRFTVHIT